MGSAIEPTAQPAPARPSTRGQTLVDNLAALHVRLAKLRDRERGFMAKCIGEAAPDGPAEKQPAPPAQGYFPAVETVLEILNADIGDLEALLAQREALF